MTSPAGSGVPTLHEDSVQELDLPGRRFRWLVAEDAVEARHCSACVIWVRPAEKVWPAHSHPNGEEVIYTISGEGRVLVAGEVASVRSGSVVLFPPRPWPTFRSAAGRTAFSASSMAKAVTLSSSTQTRKY